MHRWGTLPLLMWACGGELVEEQPPIDAGDAGIDHAHEAGVDAAPSIDVGLDVPVAIDVIEDETSAPPPGLVVLASGQQSPFGIAVDANDVFWTNFIAKSGSVMKCAISGCSNAPTAFAQAQNYPFLVAVDGTTAYWTLWGGPYAIASCGVHRAAVRLPRSSPRRSGERQDCPSRAANCSGPTRPCLMAASSRAPRAGAVRTPRSSRRIRRTSQAWSPTAPTRTGRHGTTAPSRAARSADVAPRRRSSKSSTGRSGSRSIPRPWVGIAIDGANVYWSDYDHGVIAKCSKNGCSGKPTILAWGQAGPRELAVDATSVYWANENDGTIVKMPK